MVFCRCHKFHWGYLILFLLQSLLGLGWIWYIMLSGAVALFLLIFEMAARTSLYIIFGPSRGFLITGFSPLSSMKSSSVYSAHRCISSSSSIRTDPSRPLIQLLEEHNSFPTSLLIFLCIDVESESLLTSIYFRALVNEPNFFCFSTFPANHTIQHPIPIWVFFLDLLSFCHQS